jgi:hypothetical protein
MFCIKCGAKNNEGSAFCVKCGVSLTQTTVTPVATQIPVVVVSQKKKKLSLVHIAAVIGAIVICIIVSVAIDDISSNDQYVRMVKSGTLDAYPQATLGEAFGNFMRNAKWESGLADGGVRFVNVTGKIQYNNREANAVVQFVIAGDRFEFNAFEINGVAQNYFMYWSLLEAAYEDTK